MLTGLEKVGYRLLSPSFLLEEVNRNISDLTKVSRLTKEELEQSFNIFLKRIEIIPESEYLQFLEEARKISPDKKDVPYFAVSLKFNKSPIWSREPRLKRQKVIRVLDDKEVEELLKS